MVGSRGAPAAFTTSPGTRRAAAPPPAGRAARRCAPSPLALRLGGLGGRGEARGAGHVLGPRAQPALLPAAEQQRMEPRAPAHVERADRPWAAHLVRAEGQQVHRHLRRRAPAPFPAPAPRRSGTPRPPRGSARRSRPPAAPRRPRCSPTSPRARAGRAPAPRPPRPGARRPSPSTGRTMTRRAVVLRRVRAGQHRLVLDGAHGDRGAALHAARGPGWRACRPPVPGAGEDDLARARRRSPRPGARARPPAPRGPRGPSGGCSTGCRSGPSRNGSMASRASGRSGAEAAWSR